MIRALAPFAVALLIATAPGLGIAEEEGASLDPRVVEANALLGEKSERQRVIELYGDVLSERPEDVVARMWLARVLAWDGRYDESLAQYDRLMAADPPPDWAPIERAEVLSWAGRIPEAEAAFEAILSADPGNARATRGLARTYSWSGRANQALRAYEHALELENDAEARTELATLRERIGTRGEGGVDVHGDSDDFELVAITAEGAIDIDLATRVTGRTRYTWIDSERGDTEPLADDPEDAQAFDATVGIETEFGSGFLASLEVGGRRWSHADDTFMARGLVQFTHPTGWTAGLSLEHGDFLKRSASVDAVIADLRDTTLRAWTWAGLTQMLSVYAYSEGTFVTGRSSEESQRVAGGVSFEVKPVRQYDLRLVLGSDLLHYTKSAKFYYDPTLSADGSLALAGSVPVADWLKLELEVGSGYGFARQDGNEGEGFTYRGKGGAIFNLGKWWLATRANGAITRRSSEYRYWGVGVSIGRGF